MRNTLIAISSAIALHTSSAQPTKAVSENPETFRAVQQILYDADRFVARRDPFAEAAEFEAQIELFPLPYKFSEGVSTTLIGNPYADRIGHILASPKSEEEYFAFNYAACKKLQLDILILKTALIHQYPDFDNKFQYSQKTRFCLRIALLQFQNGLRVTGIIDAETCMLARHAFPEFFEAEILPDKKKLAHIK